MVEAKGISKAYGGVQALSALLPHLPATSDYRVGEWRPSIDRPAYAAALRRIKARIEAGEVTTQDITLAGQAVRQARRIASGYPVTVSAPENR